MTSLLWDWPAHGFQQVQKAYSLAVAPLNPLRFHLIFAFSSYLSIKLIFLLLSSVRRSHFKSASQSVQKAGHTLETNTKERKGSAVFEEVRAVGKDGQVFRY